MISKEDSVGEGKASKIKMEASSSERRMTLPLKSFPPESVRVMILPTVPHSSTCFTPQTLLRSFFKTPIPQFLASLYTGEDFNALVNGRHRIDMELPSLDCFQHILSQHQVTDIEMGNHHPLSPCQS